MFQKLSRSLGIWIFWANIIHVKYYSLKCTSFRENRKNLRILIKDKPNSREANISRAKIGCVSALFSKLFDIWFWTECVQILCRASLILTTNPLKHNYTLLITLNVQFAKETKTNSWTDFPTFYNTWSNLIKVILSLTKYFDFRSIHFTVSKSLTFFRSHLLIIFWQSTYLSLMENLFSNKKCLEAY